MYMTLGYYSGLHKKENIWFEKKAFRCYRFLIELVKIFIIHVCIRGNNLDFKKNLIRCYGFSTAV